MLSSTDVKLGDFPAMVRLARSLHGAQPESVAHKRRMIAEVCKLLGSQVGSVMPTACNDPKLSPRERETLQHLLSGDSEKQVAAKLQLSRHTVHIYVKTLYKHFGVNSRGELLAKCLGGSPMQ